MQSPDTTLVQQRPALADRFEIIATLGEGAAGSVYLVRDRKRGRSKVALKVLINDDAFDEHTLARFEEEMRVCKELRHTNVIEAYDFIDLGDTIAFTMEYVDGCDLGVIFRERRKISNEDLDKIFIQLLSALENLHNHGIVHRDIKLENILIREDGLVKLSDLGLIKKLDSKGLTKAGVLLGTAQYMPPEYIKAGKYDARSDLYAVGILLFELLTGKRRLADKPGMEAIEYLIKTKFEIPKMALTGLSKKHKAIIQKVLSPKPSDRYQTAVEMAEAFKKPETDYVGDMELNGALENKVNFSNFASKLFRIDRKSPFEVALSIFSRVAILLVAIVGIYALLFLVNM